MPSPLAKKFSTTANFGKGYEPSNFVYASRYCADASRYSSASCASSGNRYVATVTPFRSSCFFTKWFATSVSASSLPLTFHVANTVRPSTSRETNLPLLTDSHPSGVLTWRRKVANDFGRSGYHCVSLLRYTPSFPI